MKVVASKSGIILLVFCLVTAVSCDNRAQKTKVAVDAVAQGLSLGFASIRQTADAYIHQAGEVYANLDRYDLATDKMDTSAGGIFESFSGNKYYYKTVKEGAAFYSSPMKAVGDQIRREIRIMQQLEGSLEASFKKHTDLVALAFFGIHEPTSIAMLYPWVDVVSFLPPGLDFRVLEWYTRGLEASGRALWSKEPFISLYGGWVFDLSAPLAVDGKTKGVMVMTVHMKNVEEKFFKPETENLFLLGKELTLVVANEPARKALNLKVIEDVDYVKQMKENAFAPASYKLSDPSQSEGLRMVGTLIAEGKTVFDQTIEGVMWSFVVGEVADETGFRVVGFYQK